MKPACTEFLNHVHDYEKSGRNFNEAWNLATERYPAIYKRMMDEGTPQRVELANAGQAAEERAAKVAREGAASYGVQSPQTSVLAGKDWKSWMEANQHAYTGKKASQMFSDVVAKYQDEGMSYDESWQHSRTRFPKLYSNMSVKN